MTPKQRAAYLAAQARYNSSPKGRARYRRYEAAHPERAARWHPIMHVKARDKR